LESASDPRCHLRVNIMINKQALVRRLARVLNKAVKAQCGSDWDREDAYAIASHMIGLNRKPARRAAQRR
jgi:hypothetical protein